MKYIFDQTAYAVTKASKYNATNKARADVTKIMESVGCKPFNVYVKKYKIPKLTGVVILFWYVRLLLKLKKQDELYIQFPINKKFLKYFFQLLQILKKRGVRLVFIIHDLDYIRFDKYKVYKEHILNCLRIADFIIAHTPAMRQHLIGEKIVSPISVLYLFDYLTEDDMTDKDYCIQHKDEVIFAGNLAKSKFLQPLNEFSFINTRFVLYGLKPEMDFHIGMEYVGAFRPDNTSFIKGGWGLVWDGDSLDECSGLYGEYLKYNASHKLSLYITSGIPVIVWSHCGLANWIVQNKLGIAIDSIKDIDSRLCRVSDDEYLSILECVRTQAKLLRNGDMLKNALCV